MINLYHYESASLEELAQHADRLIARLKQSHRSQPTPYPRNEPSSNQSLINKVLESRLDSLQSGVSELSQRENHSVAQPSHATQVPSLDSQHHFNRPFNQNSSPPLRRRDQQWLCYYHSRFGDRTRKCEGPPCPRGTAFPAHLHLHNIFSPSTQSFIHSCGVVVKASASQSVDLGFIPLVESYQMTLKNGTHSFPAWRSVFMAGCGEQAGKFACCVLGQGT